MFNAMSKEDRIQSLVHGLRLIALNEALLLQIKDMLIIKLPFAVTSCKTCLNGSNIIRGSDKKTKISTKNRVLNNLEGSGR